MLHTHQMETDTAAEEREVLLQGAMAALASNDRTQITDVRNQLREYHDMYQGDPALAFVEENLRKLDAALGEKSPDSYAYAEEAGQ